MRFRVDRFVAVATLAMHLYLPAARADDARAQLDAVFAKGTAARERYFTDLDAVRAAEAQGNAPAAAVLGPLVESELAGLRAARTETIELVRKIYVEAGGHSLLDPPIAGGDVVVPDVANPGRFVTRHVVWQPRYAFSRRWSKRSDVDEGPPFAITASGEVLLYEKLLARPASEIAAALLHVSVHFESFVTRRLCVRGGPTEAAADEDEVRALDAELEQAGPLGLDPAAVELRRLARNSLLEAGGRRRAARGDAGAQRPATGAGPGTGTGTGPGAGTGPATKPFAESNSGTLPDGAQARDAALIDPAQCAAPSPVAPPSPQLSTAAPAPSPTIPHSDEGTTKAGVEMRHRFFLDLMAGDVLNLWTHDWFENADRVTRGRVAFGIEAGFRVLPRLAILLSLQAHARGGYPPPPSLDGTPQMAVPGAVQVNTGVGLQYELPIWVPVRALMSHVPRLSIALRMLVGYSASLTLDNKSPAYHGLFVLPEIGLRYQVSDRFHIAVYPVSVPFIFYNVETSVSWRFMGIIGVDF